MALQAAAEAGFALAGGNALVVHGLVDRPPKDVDLFSPTPGATRAVDSRVVQALIEARYQVEVVRRPEDGGGEFAQFTVGHAGQTVLLDLGRDWRHRPPAQPGIGPVLDLDDAVGSKVAAVVGRGLSRHFIDGAAVAARRHDHLVRARHRSGLPGSLMSWDGPTLDQVGTATELKTSTLRSTPSTTATDRGHCRRSRRRHSHPPARPRTTAPSV